MEKATLTQTQIAQTSEPVNETTPRAAGTAASFLRRRSFLTSLATHLAVVGLSLSRLIVMTILITLAVTTLQPSPPVRARGAASGIMLDVVSATRGNARQRIDDDDDEVLLPNQRVGHPDTRILKEFSLVKIGRASCRERV